MMQEMLDFFLGAVHLYVTDPDLIPVTDAVCSVIVVSDILITASALLVKGAECLFRTLYHN